MKAEWQKRTLGDLCRLISGQHINSKDYNSESRGVGYLTGPSDFGLVNPIISKWTEQPKIQAKKGDILVTVKGSGVGKINLLNQDEVAISRQLMAIRVIDADPRFIYAFLSSTFDHFQTISTGAAIPGISREQVLGLRIDVPALPEQRRIVGILYKAFDGIATAKANAEKNLQSARDLFESYLQAVFTKRGDGWVEKAFADICEISSVLVDPRRNEYLDMPHVGGANIISKTGELIELKTAREEGLLSGKFVFDETMVLYSKIRPYLMKVARPDFRGLCSADIYPLSAKTGQLNRDYLFHLLLSPEFTNYANAGSARAGMPKVNREHLYTFRVYLPSVTKQKQIAGRLNNLLKETQRLESIYQRKLVELDELKKSLLHQAFAGLL
jgi:type I restriction enzyme, S subunit